MQSLEKIATGHMKDRLRHDFMQIVVDRLNPTGHSSDFSEDVSIDVTNFHFDDVFCQVLYNNGLNPADFEIDLFDFVICDEEDNPKDKYGRFIGSILCPYNRNSGVYMKFLEFVVKRSHALARMVLRHPEFNVAFCLIFNSFSLQDFKRIAAWDLEIGSDIFRNNDCPVLWYAFSTVLLDNHAFEKIKHITQIHGPDIMLWICNQDNQTNVNIFLKQGYIMNTESRHRMKEKLEFMTNCCPLALKKYISPYGLKENAFTIVLERCHYGTGHMKERNYEIVHNVFQHLQMSDLYEQYIENGSTLLDLVKSSKNTVVKAYLGRKFGLDLKF